MFLQGSAAWDAGRDEGGHFYFWYAAGSLRGANMCGNGFCDEGNSLFGKDAELTTYGVPWYAALISSVHPWHWRKCSASWSHAELGRGNTSAFFFDAIVVPTDIVPLKSEATSERKKGGKYVEWSLCFKLDSFDDITM